VSGEIAALDNAIAQSNRSETIKLRRIVGTAPNTVNIDVDCLAIVTSATVQQLVAGIPSTDQNIILSPTQINNAQWPGGSIPLMPPFDVDQRVPRVNADKVIVQGKMRSVAFVNPLFGGQNGKEILRIDMRVSG
jgi:hypothetical protein